MNIQKRKKQILFVDDEPNILKGLQRMLRTMRHEWDMAFVESGSKALELLSRGSFDVIVSDMRMPNMDGVTLLGEVKNRYPTIVRIILSGHSDQEMILKSVRPAHQYLSKPCSSEMLISTVSRSCSLRDFLGQNGLKQVISRIDSLPSLPAIYTEIMAELRSPEASVQRVGKIIEKDLSMCAKILQLVNSSFFGLPRHISDISQAVILLGLDIIRSLVLTIDVFSKFDPATVSTLHIEKIYEHSIKTGTIAQAIATYEHADKETLNNSFTTGLLHDIGKIIFAVNFPETYAKVFELIQHKDISFMEAEFEIMGATHAEVGAYLLGLWGLPDVIVEGVAFHHTPVKCQHKSFGPLIAVHAANIFENNSHPSREERQQAFDIAHMMQSGLYEKIPAWKKASELIAQEPYTNE